MDIRNEIKPGLIPEGAAVALGFFDGVHLGHREIIQRAIKHARENSLKPVVATFSNHPHSEITGQSPLLLTDLETRMQLLEELGVDLVLALEFNSTLRRMSAQDYLTKVLVETLNSRFISIGYDHTFGFNQEGNPDKLKQWCKKLGISVHSNNPINVHDEPVSSTRIRKSLRAGQVKVASLLLNRNHLVEGIVTQGLKRGTEIGFPTANLMIPSKIVVPAVGVYAAYATLEEKRYKCVVNIGHCPTFKEDFVDVKVETHILDFDYVELYNKKLKVEFVDRLRNEEKFNSKEDLVSQIEKDCIRAREILE